MKKYGSRRKPQVTFFDLSAIILVDIFSTAPNSLALWICTPFKWDWLVNERWWKVTLGQWFKVQRSYTLGNIWLNADCGRVDENCKAGFIWSFEADQLNLKNSRFTDEPHACMHVPLQPKWSPAHTWSVNIYAQFYVFLFFFLSFKFICLM